MGNINIKNALLNLGGSVKLYKTLVQGFKEKYTYIDDDIKIKLLNKEMEEARRLAHSIKGLAGNLGATDLQEKSKILELIVKDNFNKNVDGTIISNILETQWMEFSKELKDCVKLLNRVLESDEEELALISTSDDLKSILMNTKVVLSTEALATDETIVSEGKEDTKFENIQEQLKTLVYVLSTYNYEEIEATLLKMDDESISNYYKIRWENIKEYIRDYEYDKAKKEIREGVFNEK